MHETFLRKEGQNYPDDKYTLDYFSRLEYQVGHFEVSNKKKVLILAFSGPLPIFSF